MKNFHRGMSFIETIVWIVVFLAAVWAIVGSILAFYRSNSYTLEQAQAVSEARRGVERVVANLRETNYSSEGAYPIVAMATSSIIFYADTDSDALLEKVRYFIDGTALKRGVVDPAGDPPNYSAPETVTVVSNYVRNNTSGVNAFQFFDVNGAAITDLSKVTDLRYVKVAIVINIDVLRAPNDLTLRSSATLRNLR